MPICFQLYDKETHEGPLSLAKVDEAMCAHFNVPVHPTKYMGDWFDCIGFRLATGKDWAQIREQFKEYVEEYRGMKNDEHHGAEYYEGMLEVLSWMEERYTTNSFYSPFKD